MRDYRVAFHAPGDSLKDVSGKPETGQLKVECEFMESRKAVEKQTQRVQMEAEESLSEKPFS